MVGGGLLCGMQAMSVVWLLLGRSSEIDRGEWGAAPLVRQGEVKIVHAVTAAAPHEVFSLLPLSSAALLLPIVVSAARLLDALFRVLASSALPIVSPPQTSLSPLQLGARRPLSVAPLLLSTLRLQLPPRSLCVSSAFLRNLARQHSAT